MIAERPIRPQGGCLLTLASIEFRDVIAERRLNGGEHEGKPFILASIEFRDVIAERRQHGAAEGGLVVGRFNRVPRCDRGKAEKAVADTAQAAQASIEFRDVIAERYDEQGIMFL